MDKQTYLTRLPSIPLWLIPRFPDWEGEPSEEEIKKWECRWGKVEGSIGWIERSGVDGYLYNINPYWSAGKEIKGKPDMVWISREPNWEDISYVPDDIAESSLSAMNKLHMLSLALTGLFIAGGIGVAYKIVK